MNSTASTKKGQVLIVDDQEFNIKILANIISNDYLVQDANSGPKALEIASGSNPPDLILLDIIMPDMDGYEVCRRLKENKKTRNIPVIFVTAKDSPEEEEYGLGIGAVDYLSKPFHPAIIRARVRGHIDRRLAQESLDTKQREQRELLDNIRAGVILVNSESYKIEYVNPMAAMMIGVLPDDLIGNSCRHFFCSQHGEKCPATSGFTEIDNSEEIMFCADKSEKQILKSVSIVHIGNKELFLETFVDITLYKQMEIELRHAQKMESVGQLAAGIAHEINTPVQFVGDNINFLKDAFADLFELQKKETALISNVGKEGIDPRILTKIDDAIEEADLEYLEEEIPKSIDQSLDGVQRIAKIVSAMKAFSHPGSEEMTSSNINDAIETTITVASNEWKYTAKIKTDLALNLPAVPCLLGEFNQVVLNMIVNARDAIVDKFGEDCSDKGVIDISTKVTGNMAEIRISDNGHGMEEDVKRRIFDPFFTTKEVGRGSGQGLAIAYNLIVDKHRGELHVESESGQGTTFIIRLPLTQTDE